MSAQQPQHTKYGFSKTLDVPYDEGVLNPAKVDPDMRELMREQRPGV